MKKIIILIFILSSMFLIGCDVVDENSTSVSSDSFVDNSNVTICFESYTKETTSSIESIVPQHTAADPETTETTVKQNITYVVNTNSGKFHYSSCSSAKSINEENKMIHEGSRDELIKLGYEPCKRCEP